MSTKLVDAYRVRIAQFVFGALSLLLISAPGFASATLTSVGVGTQSPNPVTPGSSVTYTVTVNQSSQHAVSITNVTGLPTGATWSANAPSCQLFNGSKAFTITVNTTAATPAGSSPIVVTATRWTSTTQATCTGANGTLTGNGTLVVAGASKVNTTTTITSDSPDPSTVNQAYSVAVSVVRASGTNTPTGSVTVSDGTNSCNISSLTGSNGTATGSCNLTSTTQGSKTITATYAGDTNFNGGSGTTAHTVNAVALTPQTVTVTSHAPANSQNGASFPVAATASSNLSVAITVTGGCTLSGGTVTMNSDTTACVVHYNQAGNATFAAAPEVTETTAASAACTATAVDPNNKITNPSFATTPNSATDWSQDNSLTGGSGTFSVVTDAHLSDCKAANITVSNYAGGDAKWTSNAVPAAGKYFLYSEWYKSGTTTQIGYFDNNGNFTWLKDVPSTNNTWVQFQTDILVPAGVTSIQMAHLIFSNGSLTTDDYSLTEATPPVFPHGLVTLSFDDGWDTFNQNAYPILQSSGLESTAYIISQANVTDPGDYMTNAQIQAIAASATTTEIGAHTRNHLDLISDYAQDPAGMQTQYGYGSEAALIAGEVGSSATDLRTLMTGIPNQPVLTFAYPYGSYRNADNTINADVRSAITTAGFTSARSVDDGFNLTNTDKFALKQKHITNTTTFTGGPAGTNVKDWIDQAISQKVWLVLMFHDVRPVLDTCVDRSNPDIADQDCTSTALLQQIADYLKPMEKATPGTVVTMSQGATAMGPSHTVTASSDANGVIAPNGPVTVVNGGNQTFTFTPNTGYKLATVTVDGVAATPVGNTVSLTNVTADHTVAVTFVSDDVPPTLSLTTTVSSPTNVTTIPVTATFSRPVTGFDVSDVSATNGTVSNFVAASSTVYTFSVAPVADGDVSVSVAAGLATDVASSTLVSSASNVVIVNVNHNIPVINLNGDAYVSVALGGTYTETATVSGTTTLPTVTGTVNTAVVGTTTLTYTFTDGAGNVAAPVTRIVAVTELGGISNEVSSNVTDSNFTVTWTTAASGTSRVVYDTVSHNPLVATDANYGYANSSVEDAATSTTHSVTITGLRSGVTYYFRAISHASPDVVGTEMSITTSGAQSSGGGGCGSCGGGGGSGGGPIGTFGGGGGFYYNGQQQGSGVVLGASTTSQGTGNGSSSSFKFLKNLSKGMRNSDVVELQKRLVAEGFLTIDAPTNYYGSMTFAAVMAYQKAHGIEQVGNVGPKTRAALNGSTSVDNTSLVEVLKAQLKILMDKLAALMASGSTSSSTSTSTSTAMTGTSTPSMTGTTTPATTGTTTSATTSTSTTATTSTSTTSTSTQQ